MVDAQGFPVSQQATSDLRIISAFSTGIMSVTCLRPLP
jgi:hypothetical protein